MHNRFLLFSTKPLLFTIPQLFVVSVIVFFLIRLLPGKAGFAEVGDGSYVKLAEALAN